MEAKNGNVILIIFSADEICSLKHVQVHDKNCFPITATAGDKEVSFSMATKAQKEILW